MRLPFCLNTATIKHLPLNLQIRVTSEVGFQRIGLWLDDIEAAIRHGFPLRDIKGWLDQAALRVEELCFLGGWQDAPDGSFEHILQSAHRICQLSEALGCAIVVVTPAPSAGLLDSAPTRFRQVCQVAADYGVRIALEFPGTAAEVKDISTAWWIVSNAGCENGGLVLDSFHFFLGGSTWEDLTLVPGEKIFLVHLSDAMDVPLGKLREFHDWRTFPGEGTLNFRPLFQNLQALCYQGVFSLEIWNKRLSELNPMEVARKGFESLAKLEQYAGSLETVRSLPGGK